MKNKIIFSLSLLIFASLVVSVYASAQPQTWELKIYKGWNLVSLLVMGGRPEIYEITCPFQDLIVLYGYDPLEKGYVKIKDVTEADPDRGIFNSAGEFFKGKYGTRDGKYQNYIARDPANSGWLYSTKDCTISFPNDRPEFTLKYFTGPPTANRKFPAGWNFLTVFPDMVNKDLYEMKGDCAIEKVYIWNPENQVWMNMKDLKFPGILVGSGVVFKTSNDCLLGKVTLPEAPALPE